MFERFTDRARRVVVHAQGEARLLNHNYIGTEHVLLGLLREGEGIAAQALASKGITLEETRAKTLELLGSGTSAPSGHVPFTPNSKKLLERSLREAMQLGHNHIGTEHILLGLIREDEGRAHEVLLLLDANLASLRQEVIRLLQLHPAGDSGGAPSGPPTLEAPASRVIVAPAAGVGSANRGCWFCGGDLWDLGYAVTGAGAVICERCVAAAGEVVAAAKASGETSVTLFHLPPRVTGTVPGPDAVAGICEAFTAVFGGREISDDVDDVLEDSKALRAARNELQARVPAPQALTHVERILFENPDRALVRYTVMNVGPTLHLEGIAIFQDGHWKVSRDTWCGVVARAGVQCPPREE